MNKHLFSLAVLAVSLAATAQTEAVFDFSKPTTLVPSVIEPAQKQAFPLDGMTFSNGDVEISFTAAETGNTHVRLYHSYDAGIDLRLYDGDAMTVSTTNPELCIESVKFTMSLSGAASGTNDINFTPSTGDFDWAAETWTPDAGSRVKSIELTSAEQSRIYTVTVSLASDSQTLIEEAETIDAADEYFNLLGRRLDRKPATPGIYIRKQGKQTERIIIK